MGQLIASRETITPLLEDGNSENLIPILQRIQAHFGYLPRLALELLAQKISVPLSHVYGVATFYSQFRFTPKGDHHIKICHGTACHVAGVTQLETRIRQKLGLGEKEENTKDGGHSVEQVACLGCCSLAPVWSLDDKLYGAEQSSKLESILKASKKCGGCHE